MQGNDDTAIQIFWRNRRTSLRRGEQAQDRSTELFAMQAGRWEKSKVGRLDG